MVLLTTETLHHAFFAREVGAHFPWAKILVETKTFRPPFETGHAFEKTREDIESDRFFERHPVSLRSMSDVLVVESMNSRSALDELEKLKPDVILVFGTGKLSSAVIDLCPEGIINLHGGDPEEYRGLDTHLWAVYHHDFSGLATTLHRLNAALDDGEIILKQSIPLTKGMKLAELRAANTQVCVELALAGLDMFARSKGFDSRPQSKRGRYYSFMPACLKDICVRRFEAYTEKL